MGLGGARPVAFLVGGMRAAMFVQVPIAGGVTAAREPCSPAASNDKAPRMRSYRRLLAPLLPLTVHPDAVCPPLGSPAVASPPPGHPCTVATTGVFLECGPKALLTCVMSRDSP